MYAEEGKNCPIFFSLEIFGDKWSLLILRDILHFDKQHYNEYLESEEGISTNILADRLKKLEKEGIISKKRDPANKKQFIYSPTKKCLDLVPIILEIAVWGAKYDPDTKAPPKEMARIRNNRKEYIESIRAKFKYVDA
ncbi:MAG: helix-turn-helix domain-containing protein [Thermodesulfobacteriota bacterium]|jgi:DNA-binding HxlR family transcriptional regulator|nr:helix-turn-helix domain-containing protein [Candidatus Dadabacteria bacterium]